MRQALKRRRARTHRRENRLLAKKIRAGRRIFEIRQRLSGAGLVHFWRIPERVGAFAPWYGVRRRLLDPRLTIDGMDRIATASAGKPYWDGRCWA